MNKISLWLLKYLSKASLSREDRILYTGQLLEALDGALVKDIILVNEQGELLVNGRPLTAQERSAYAKIAQAALENPVMKLIWEQIRYVCFKEGVSKGNNADSIIFYRTALWYGEQERLWLRLFAGDPDGN